MKTVSGAWVLKLLLLSIAGEPVAAPWRDTYASSADAIAEESNAHPLYGSEDGAARTASVFVGASWFESRHDPKAKGDGKCAAWKPGVSEEEKKLGTASPWCLKKVEPHSFCLGQVNDSNFKWLGITKPEELLDDVRVCVRAMGKMFAESFRKGRECGLPILDRLSWYTGGGAVGCDATAKGRHRMLKAGWLFAHLPAE